MSKKYASHNSLLPLFFAWQLAPNGSNYNLSFSYSIKGEEEVNLIIEALNQLVRSKAHLRQTFSLENGRLIAHIHDSLAAEVAFFHCHKEDLQELEERLIQQPHDISSKSAIKLSIIQLDDHDGYIALFNIHHIIMDGQSIDFFIENLNLLIANKEIQQETSEQYVAKVTVEPLLQEEINDDAIVNYIKEVNNVAVELSQANLSSSDKVWFYTDILPEKLKHELILLSGQHKISMFNLFLLAWGIFNAKIFDQNDMLISYPISVRKNKLIEGCFINNVVSRIKIKADDSYLSLIDLWSNEAALLKKISKTRLSDKLSVGLIPSFINSNVARPLALIIKGKRYVAKSYPQIANSSLSIKYRKHNDNYFFSCEVLAELFPEHFSSSILSRFFNYLKNLLSNPSISLSDTDILFSHEKQQILYDFNDSHCYYPNNTSLIALFEEQVKKTPDNIALVYENKKLTYSELNKLANQLAHYLKNTFTIGPDSLIALLLDRNEGTIISILAVLKSGAAYVPLEPNSPQERINYILTDTKASIILTNKIYLEKLTCSESHQQHRHIVELDSPQLKTALTYERCTNPVNNVASRQLIYIIYTSGTTGNPNGVMVEQRSVVNTIFSMFKVYAKENKKTPLKITAFTSYIFDVSVSEFFVALLRGHELHILGNPIRQNIVLVSKYINENRINYAYLPPVLLASLPRINYPSLYGIIYAGEPCDKKTAQYWSKKHKLFNYYGPTETSIYSTGLQIKSSEVNLIGKPITNTTVYVLGSNRTLRPIGLVGELFIGGIGLARGYLNRKELTAERFIPNPFQTLQEKQADECSRLYKTGDIVRWCPDGNIEYLGRNDFQVKIRGYRIELSEIENKLTSYPGIKVAIVLAKEEKNTSTFPNKYLVAYYLADQKVDETRLLDYLTTELPEYMLPNVFVHLEKIPLTINGKLDRKALPEPNLFSIESYIPPKNFHQQLVCAAFAQVLNLEKVGINDNFFKLGGDSIKAIALIAKLQGNFSIGIADIFNLKTPAQISDHRLLIGNNLKRNLENFQIINETQYPVEEDMRNKLKNYLNTNKKIAIANQKPIKNVLLTGATGFLGSNLLFQLLKSTNYNIFMLIRAQSNDDAFDRINKKFQFYFGKNLHNEHNKRVFVFSADITKNNLKLSQNAYQFMIDTIDSIIHSAAFTKHYGDYEQFYLANVQATVNMLELAKLTKLKDFHYISTVSVLNKGYVPGYKYFYFTEEDMGNNLEGATNIYIKTKRDGEEIVVKYREQGVISNIYRIGNLAFMASNGRAQENIKDNSFFNRISCLLKLGIATSPINMEEISPADLTAQAIVKLFDKQQLGNGIFHVFSPHLYDVVKNINQKGIVQIKMLKNSNFINSILDFLSKSDYEGVVQRFLLHQGWFDEPYAGSTRIQVLQNKTQAILEQLGFKWTYITSETFEKYFGMEIKNGRSAKNLETA